MFKDNNIGNSPIKSLFAELLRLDIELDSLPDPAGDEELSEIRDHQWAVAAQIDTTLARNLGELSYKNRAMQLMAERDKEFDCHVPGSARSLALSIAADVIRLACTPAEEVAA